MGDLLIELDWQVLTESNLLGKVGTEINAKGHLAFFFLMEKMRPGKFVFCLGSHNFLVAKLNRVLFPFFPQTTFFYF